MKGKRQIYRDRSSHKKFNDAYPVFAQQEGDQRNIQEGTLFKQDFYIMEDGKEAQARTVAEIFMIEAMAYFMGEWERSS